jgi:hypothetical protein
VQSSDGLVAEDYYKQGLAVNQRLARSQAAAALGIGGTLAVESEAGGARLRLIGAGDGRYVGRVGALAPGRWHVIVEDGEGRWRIRGEMRSPQERTADLRAGQ